MDGGAIQRLFGGACDFVLAAAQPAHFDALPLGLPEVAVWGRSNVGKSSLINAVTGRKGLARASNTPGRTQQIIFFNLADRLMLADLPGYGHAKAPPEEIKRWHGLMKAYVAKRAALRAVMLLLDSRHGLKANDLEKMRLLDSAAVSYQIVLTKADQLRGAASGAAEVQQAVEARLKKHPAARPEVLLTSAEKGEGIEAVRAFLAEYALSSA